MHLKSIVKIIAFLLVFVLLLNFVSNVFTLSSNNHEYQFMSGVYEEKENTLDAVYIGSSSTYAFWNPMVAFKEYGITVPNYSCSSQPFIIAKYLLIEARKTQPDAVYLFNVNTISNEGFGGAGSNHVVMHRVLDSMPFSLNKLRLTKYMADIAGFSFTDSLEYYLPLIRYHSKLDDLDESHFNPQPNGFKGADYFDYYFNGSTDISEFYVNSDDKIELSDILADSIDDLLDYCDENKVKAVFVASPRAEAGKEEVKLINKVLDTIESRGYPTIDLIEDYEKANLDLTQDYYNKRHTNIHGSIKYTQYISQYLIKNYGFEDKRNNKNYESWNDGLKEYSKLMDKQVIDFELDATHRDYTLKRPEISVSQANGGVSVTWNEINGADGYAVYRKTSGSGWKKLGVQRDTNFVDTEINSKTKYKYTIVPYSTKNGEQYFGDYLYKGKSITTN